VVIEYNQMKNDFRASCWSVTINNPTGADEENIAIARQKGWIVEGQKEVGANGTPHYQLMVKSGQQRCSAIRSAFPRAHVEKAHSPEALAQYVHKAETRIADIPQACDNYPSQQKMWDMFAYMIYEKYETGSEWRSSGIETWDEDRWLSEFDTFVGLHIQDGYVLEGVAVNPQVRSGVKKFGFSIYLRSVDRKFGGYTPRQTDRQTDEEDISVVDITEDASSEDEGASEEASTSEGEGVHDQDSCSGENRS
jgi:hypothetical protein